MAAYKSVTDVDILDKEQGCCTQAAAKVFPSGYTKELKSTLKIAWAIVLTQVLDINFQPIAIMFGGHLGKIELDSIALSNTLINVLGCSIIIGMSSSCETVFSQCYGFGNYKMIGVFLQRSLYIHVLAMVVCYAIHLNITQILIAIGQDPQVSHETGRYLLYFMPGLMCYCLATVIRKYTQCQNIVIPHIFILGIGHLLHALCQYLFLYKFNMGIEGSALAQDVTFFFILVATVIYTLCSKAHKQCWPGWDWRGLTEWGPLFRLALYGLLMVCFEWWAFEMSILVAGSLGTTELGAQSISFNLDVMYYGCIYGIGIATTVRVGQLLGAGCPTQAKTSARVGLTITGVMALTMATIFTLARYELPKLFTSDPDVISMVAGVLPILAVYSSGNAIIVIVRGIFRGVGWQKLGSILSFVSFYVLAWPIAAPLLILTSLGIKGMWLGFMVGIVLSGLCHLTIMGCLNWEQLSEQAVSRANEETSTDQKIQKIEEEELPTDQTPLIRSTSSSMLSNRSPPKKYDDNLSDSNQSEYEDTKIQRSVIVKRLVTLLIFLLILTGSIIIRLVTDSQAQHISSLVITTESYDNVTMQSHDNVTTPL